MSEASTPAPTDPPSEWGGEQGEAERGRRPAPWREALAGLVFLSSLLGLGFLVWSSQAEGGSEGVRVAEVGQAPPPLEGVKAWLKLPAGTAPAWAEEGRLDFEALRGKVVVLEFWSAWCSQCGAANAELNALHGEGRADLAVIGVTMRDRYVEEPRILEHVRDRISFPVALLARGQAIASYEVREIPRAVILGRQGRVRWIGKGGTESFRAALGAELERSP